MSIKLMNKVAEIKTGSPTKKMILFMLADRANDEGFCWPSLKTIAKVCELNEATVSRNIKSMINDGLLWAEKKKMGGKFNNNVYHLTLNHIAQDHMAEDQPPHDSESADRIAQSQVEPPVQPAINPHSAESGESASEHEQSKQRGEAPTTAGPSSADFFERFKEVTGKNLRVMDEKFKRQFRARIKEGFTLEEMVTATRNAFASEHHQKNRQYLTPEFITRADKLQTWLYSAPDKPTNIPRSAWEGLE